MAMLNETRFVFEQKQLSYFIYVINRVILFYFSVSTLGALFVYDKTSWGMIGAIDIIILWSYYAFRPLNLFHPNNIVFAFYFLYVILPSSILYLFHFLSLQLVLPSPPPNWLSFNPQVYQHILVSFIFIFYGLSFFCRNINPKPPTPILISMSNFWALLIAIVFLHLVFIEQSGGFDMWVNHYQEAFLQKRKGLGALSFFIVFLTPVLCFILGLITWQTKGKRKFLLIGVSLLLMLFFSYFQGLKSRYPIFVIIYFYPYLQQIKLTKKMLVFFSCVFFLFLFMANYFRSDGYYSSFAMHVEYLMSYFNVFYLHDMFLHDFPSGLFNTLHFPFVKYMQFFYGFNSMADFDLSVMLTKFYFPTQWYLESGTQQWPLVSDLYFNFYGCLFSWFPLLVYMFILARLYKHFCQFHLNIILLYLLEFFRLFSTLRSTLIPWDIFVVMFFYGLIYLYLKITIRNNVISERT